MWDLQKWSTCRLHTENAMQIESDNELEHHIYWYKIRYGKVMEEELGTVL